VSLLAVAHTIARRPNPKSYEDYIKDYYTLITDDMVASATDELQHNGVFCKSVSKFYNLDDAAEIGRIYKQAITDHFKNDADEYAVNKMNEDSYL